MRVHKLKYKKKQRIKTGKHLLWTKIKTNLDPLDETKLNLKDEINPS